MSEQEIYIEAISRRDSADRRRFLDEVCAGNEFLRERVEALIRQSDQLGSFLEHSPQHVGVTADISVVSEKPGTIIGPYKLLQQIGEGGMGVVYMAEQIEPVKRRVALKIIKPGMDSRQVIARFEAERQALSLMDHPNIAKVLDAGTTESGRPYFVMELVKGQPITQYCDEKHLTPRQRLELLLPVCQAIQHAHQKGIIHRDIKPTNILVAEYDQQPVPKVIDFGVAKATSQTLTEKTMFTGLGQIVGTLEYMSPEQAKVNQLDIDTRSDIYSLGVLLYELLTGSTPFDKQRLRSAAFDEMLRIIREEEPPRPSTKLSSSETLPSVAANRSMEPARLSRSVRGELDWIVMKALEKDRNRRYEAANGLATDIQRYLADEPVQACPPSASYRLRKFARRNKGGLAVAAMVLFFLVLLGSGVGWAVRDRAAREAAIAQERANREAESKRERETRRAKVAGQVESIFAEVDRLEKEHNWPEALAAARRAEAVIAGGEADVETAQRVRQRLKDLEFIDRLEQVRMQRLTWVEGNFDNTGKFDFAGADREYGRAFRAYGVDVERLSVEEAVGRLKARPALAMPLAAALDDWAYTQRRDSKKDAAGWNRLVAVARGIDTEPLRDRLRSALGRPDSEVQDELRRLAESIDVRAQNPATLFVLARNLQPVNSDSAIRILREARYVYPGDFWLNFELGAALAKQKDHEGAIRFYTAVVSIRPNSTAALNNLGLALHDQKRLDEAIICYHKAIEIDPKFAYAYNGLGDALIAQKKLDEAVAVYRKAIALYPKWPAAYNGLGNALRGQQKLDEAINAYRKTIEIEPRLGSYNGLGNALRGQKKLDEAIATFKRAIEINPKSAIYYNSLGALLCDDLKDYDKAVECFRKAIELEPNNAGARCNLGNALLRQKKLDEAIAAYRKAIEIDPNLASACNGLAWLLATCPDAKLRDPNQAVTLAKKAVELAPAHPGYPNTLGAAHYRAGDWKAAIAALEKSMALGKGGNSNDWFFLAMAHWQLGEKDKAREWYDRAVQWMDNNQPTDEELRRFRVEAAELLELKEKK